jgi:hypothetical protein
VLREEEPLDEELLDLLPLYDCPPPGRAEETSALPSTTRSKPIKATAKDLRLMCAPRRGAR